MRIAKWLIEGGKMLVEFGDHLFMQEARLDSLGARRAPPKESGELTNVIREAILISRAECTDEDWLRENGRRDQECVRYGITRDQVAGILAACTKREKKSRLAPVPRPSVAKVTSKKPVLKRPIQKQVVKTEPTVLDKTTWGLIPLEKDGLIDQPPKYPFREVTTDDYELVLSVFASCEKQKKDWGMMRRELACMRRLTTQQIAGIIAVHNRKKPLNAPVAHA